MPADKTKWYLRTQKGFIGDVFIALLVFLLIPSIVLVAFYTAGGIIQGDLQGMANNGLLNQTAVNNANAMYHLLNYFDIIIPFLLLGSMVAIFVYAAFLNASRILLGVGFLLMIILTFVSFYISNAWYAILTNPVLASATANFPHIVYLVDYLPVLEAVLTIVYLLIATIRLRNGSIPESGGSPLTPAW